MKDDFSGVAVGETPANEPTPAPIPDAP
ncbi:hypothetical protein LCGC14_2600460, partial [marine sediment metagenome]